MPIDKELVRQAEVERARIPPLSQLGRSDMACDMLYFHEHVQPTKASDLGAAARGIEIHCNLPAYLDHLVRIRRATDLEIFDSLAKGVGAEAWGFCRNFETTTPLTRTKSSPLLPGSAVLLPVQTLGELFSLLVRKAGRAPAKARVALLSWRDAFSLIETSADVMVAAADLATDHRLSIWEAVILSAAAEAGCRLLLSEDLQEGYTWKGVTVTNPFRTPRHELLASLLTASGS
jgi:predicted nucleic acid-binding protein